MTTTMTFNLEEEIETIKDLLDNYIPLVDEHRPVFYDDIRPLVIMMDAELREQDIKNRDERSQIRKKILSDLIGREIESTYDLRLYECSILLKQFGIREVLEGITKKYKDQIDSGE